jgi:transposase
MELTDKQKQWTRLEPIILQSVCKKNSRGRKPRDPREVLNDILWVLRTGAPWKDLPDRYRPHQTCHRRFQHWTKAGVFRRIIEELAAGQTCRNAAELIFTRRSLTVTLFPQKRGDAVGWKNWARHQDHGN